MNLNINNFKKMTWALSLLIVISCVSSGNKNRSEVKEEIDGFPLGTFGYDVAFFKKCNIETIELKEQNSNAGILLAPGYQGRVMTSTADGNQGTSFGWINHKLIQSGVINSQFNPVGGEERFWLGPEGGPFSIYFEQGDEQVYKNWKVPAVIDTEAFEIKNQQPGSVTFAKNTSLKNAAGTQFSMGIERTVSLLPKEKLQSLFQVDFSSDELNVVGYQSENMLTNLGDRAWTREEGLLSVWILCMFSPSPNTTVFIPYRDEVEGVVVNDEYFGKVPSERLKIEDRVVYFKIDGALRSKIGIPPHRAKNLCGSYDSEREILTLVWGSLPSEPMDYVNSKWGDQEDPFEGDVINAYNDGPVEDGSIMGPFYEVETSSPAAALDPGKSLTHIQRVVHIQGSRKELSRLTEQLFGLDLNTIATMFQ